jgi:hypothetical protein
VEGHLAQSELHFAPYSRPEREQLVANARAQLGEAAFAAAWAAGVTMTLDEAAALAKAS